MPNGLTRSDTGSESDASSEPARLRSAERALARMEGELGTNLRERVAALEEAQKSLATKADVAALRSNQENLATKADVERAKLWFVGGMVGAGLSMLIVVVRLLSWIWPQGNQPSS